MTSKPTLKEALEGAIRDYNMWASRSKGWDTVKAYDELRGVFFNKLMTQLRLAGEVRNSSSFYGRDIHPEDLLCKVNPDGLLTQLDINVPKSSIELSGHRGILLCNLSEATKQVSYAVLAGSQEYRIDSIVNDIKAFKL